MGIRKFKAELEIKLQSASSWFQPPDLHEVVQQLLSESLTPQVLK